MNDERFDFASMRDLSLAQLWEATRSHDPRTIRRAERELERRHRETLNEQAARNRARIRFWFSRHQEVILDAFVILMIIVAALFTLYIILGPS